MDASIFLQSESLFPSEENLIFITSASLCCSWKGEETEKGGT